MVKLSLRRVIGVNAVITVVVGRQIATSITLYARPVETITLVVSRCHVLDHDAISGNLVGIAKLEISIHNHGIAITSANGDVRSAHQDRFMIDAWGNRDEITSFGCFDSIGDSGIVLWH